MAKVKYPFGTVAARGIFKTGRGNQFKEVDTDEVDPVTGNKIFQRVAIGPLTGPIAFRRNGTVSSPAASPKSQQDTLNASAVETVVFAEEWKAMGEEEKESYRQIGRQTAGLRTMHNVGRLTGFALYCKVRRGEITRRPRKSTAGKGSGLSRFTRLLQHESDLRFGGSKHRGCAAPEGTCDPFEAQVSETERNRERLDRNDNSGER